MENKINLQEQNFPIKINELNLSLKDMNDLGKVIGKIPINLVIKKLSDELFLAKLEMNVQFQNLCQSCLSNTNFEITIRSKVALKDVSAQQEKDDIQYDIHYQNLEEFNVSKFLTEEIYLNYPSTVFCNSEECLKKIAIAFTDSNRPFKKIRDLID